MILPTTTSSSSEMADISRVRKNKTDVKDKNKLLEGIAVEKQTL
jgi:hypothetical protein